MRSKIYLPLISAIILTFASCGQKYRTFDGNTWGTTFHIVYKSDSNLDDSIRGVMNQVDSELSMFNPLSTVSRINAGLTDSVTPWFCDILDAARLPNYLSGGAYDPTVAPLVDLWGFGRADTAAEPDSAAIVRALASVGLERVGIQDMRIVRPDSLTSFDFSSIAKGFGIDRIADMLERNSVNDYMVEIGGEIALAGHNPDGRKWRIQIDAPVRTPEHTRLTVMEMGPERTALATSGNYRNYRTDPDGTIHGHILDARTGRPADTDILSASVIARTCCRADAFATAAMTMTDSAALDVLRANELHGILVIARADSLDIQNF